MAYSTETLYYCLASQKVYTASQARWAVGIDPSTFDATTLPTYGLYTVIPTVDYFNKSLYTTAATYTISGDNAVQAWVPTAITLADAKTAGSGQLVHTVTGRIINLINASGFTLRIFVTVAAQLIGDRPARFASWVTRRTDATNQLNTYMTNVGSAASVDAVNAIVSPAWGYIDIARDPANPNNLLASDFTTGKFYAKSLAKSAFELYFPQTTTTVAYSSGFAATAAAFTADDTTVQIRRTSNSLVVDEFVVAAAETAAINSVEFGYRKYQDVTPASSTSYGAG